MELAIIYISSLLSLLYTFGKPKINIMFSTIVFSLYEHNYNVTITVWQVLKINIFTLMSSFALFKGPPLINLGVTNSCRSYIFAAESPLVGVAEWVVSPEQESAGMGRSAGVQVTIGQVCPGAQCPPWLMWHIWREPRAVQFGPIHCRLLYNSGLLGWD